MTPEKTNHEKHNEMRCKKTGTISSLDPLKALVLWDFLSPSGNAGKCSQRVTRVTRWKAGSERIKIADNLINLLIFIIAEIDLEVVY